MGLVLGGHTTQGTAQVGNRQALSASGFAALHRLQCSPKRQERDNREAADVQAELDAAIQHLAFAVFQNPLVSKSQFMHVVLANQT